MGSVRGSFVRYPVTPSVGIGPWPKSVSLSTIRSVGHQELHGITFLEAGWVAIRKLWPSNPELLQ